eukprot:3679615-Pyramimonas_sp.AAC.1
MQAGGRGFEPQGGRMRVLLVSNMAMSNGRTLSTRSAEAAQKRLRSFIRSSQAYHESAPHLPFGGAVPFAHQKPFASPACAPRLHHSLGSP